MIDPSLLANRCCDPTAVPAGLFLSSPGMLIMGLVGGHFLADFGLQSAYMAAHKSRHEGASQDWWIVLMAHCMIHALVVAVVTGSAALGFAEAVLHFAIDDSKCAKRLSYAGDQILHLACKLAWFAAVLLTQS